MEKSNHPRNAVVQIEKGIIQPRPPRVKSVVVKTVGAYPAVAQPYLDVARHFSNPFLVGPPICDELIALVHHIFTEAEASLVRHLKPFRPPKTAKSVAAAAHRPVEEVAPILDRLADEKFTIFSLGSGDKRRYFLVPLFPGVMENILFRNSLDNLTPWHQTFAELFEALYETGYMTDYARRPAEMVRYLPVQRTLDALPAAWPSDRLPAILDRYDTFAITYCQCRLTEKMLGRGCARPLETCVIMGNYAEKLIRDGRMRAVERKEVLEIKQQAEAAGLVTWINNDESGKGTNISCSCCGCCCHMLRLVTEFNVPAMVAPPHFLPVFDTRLCTACGKCAENCTMGAITVDTINKTHAHDLSRCIGCGICVAVCDHHAITMQEAPAYKAPPKNRLAVLARILPNTIRNALFAAKAHKPDA